MVGVFIVENEKKNECSFTLAEENENGNYNIELGPGDQCTFSMELDKPIKEAVEFIENFVKMDLPKQLDELEAEQKKGKK